ncbi:iron ABC transporter substrate-binding protein [Actinomadura sp.]|uniref:iron ABC transporter substrate-binding protein n=1 Tax=Actinomadura sp. TaxID=1989 RepID=UPI00335F5B34
MNRRLRQAPVVGAALVVMALATACGSGGKEAALDPDKLTIYSAQHGDLMDAWVEGFTKDTGIEVQVREGADSSMGNQIVAEGKRSPADVFLTENAPAITVVQNAGLMAPVEQTTLDQVDPAFRPGSGKWVGIAARSTVLVYNPGMVSEADLPASMMDLAKPEYAGKWGAAPAGADFQAIVAGLLEAKGEAATSQWLAGLKKNAKVYQNNIATMKAVNAGQVPMGIMYHYYWYRDQALTKDGSKNTRLHYFKNQDVGAFVSISGGGVLASSKHPADAQKFLAWVTGPKGQAAISASKSMQYAVGKGQPSDPALPPLKSLQAPKIDPYTLDGPKVIKLMTQAGII